MPAVIALMLMLLFFVAMVGGLMILFGPWALAGGGLVGLAWITFAVETKDW